MKKSDMELSALPNKNFEKKGFIVGDYLTWWIIALGVLLLSAIMYFILTNNSSSALEYFKNFLRFGK